MVAVKTSATGVGMVPINQPTLKLTTLSNKLCPKITIAKHGANMPRVITAAPANAYATFPPLYPSAP